MSWTGRIVGAFIGFLIGGFPAIIGFILGYYLYDKPRNQAKLNTINAQRAFTGAGTSPQNHSRLITCTFRLMGYVARGAGAINQDHIRLAERLMDMMMLDQTRRHEAIEAFNFGKSPEFDLNAEMQNIREVVGNNPHIISYLLEIQVAIAIADERLDQGEHERLLLVAQALGLDPATMERLIQIRIAEQQFQRFSQRFNQARQKAYEQRYGSGSSYDYYGNRSYEHYDKEGFEESEQDEQDTRSSTAHASQSDLDNAYAILGVSKDSSWDEVKRAHRKLMLKYHPDRLASQGLPPEMVKLYTQKAQDIQAAFSLIKSARGER